MKDNDLKKARQKISAAVARSSQRTLAGRANVSQSVFSTFLSGKHDPVGENREKILRFADTLEDDGRSKVIENVSRETPAKPGVVRESVSLYKSANTGDPVEAVIRAGQIEQTEWVLAFAKRILMASVDNISMLEREIQGLREREAAIKDAVRDAEEKAPRVRQKKSDAR